MRPGADYMRAGYDRPPDPPESEPHVCDTCQWFEPCPCGRCGWGVCRYFNDNDYMSEDSDCCHWKEA